MTESRTRRVAPPFSAAVAPRGLVSERAGCLSMMVSRFAERCDAQADRTSNGSLLTLTISHGLRYSTGTSVATVMSR
jgi:hypothetical protein